MSDSVRPHRQQPMRPPRPCDSPGKNTGVGCHVLLQCMKVKSESEVAQSCPTLSDPMDCSPPGSSVHGIFQARVLEWGATALPDTIHAAAAAKSLQSCPTLCNPIDGSPPGSSAQGIFQPRVGAHHTSTKSVALHFQSDFLELWGTVSQSSAELLSR